MKAKIDGDTKEKERVVEDTKEMAENLKTIQKNTKKNKEIVNELEKLGSQNLKVL